MIIDVNVSNKVLQTDMPFSDIFLSRWWPNGTLNDIAMCKGTVIFQELL